MPNNPSLGHWSSRLAPSWRSRLAALRLSWLAPSAFALVAVLQGCGAAPPLPEDELFREASIALEEESYSTAITDYKKLLEEYPFSDKAEIASLNIAFAHYLKEEYIEAISAFNDFERLYPVSPLLPFVSYNIGMCWLEQAKAADRDASASDQALRQFRKVANEFPGTLYADLAVFRQQQARENLAAHEIVVGDYYFERKRLEAASARYRYVLKEYPTTESAARAKARLENLEVAVVRHPPPILPESTAPPEKPKEEKAEAQQEGRKGPPPEVVVPGPADPSATETGEPSPPTKPEPDKF